MKPKRVLTPSGGKGPQNQFSIAKARAYWHMLGPGLTTGAADDDPSGIATYSQTGARYGFSFLWLALFTFPFMAIVQEMCARIGMVTGKGLAANIKNYYPRWVLYACTVLLFFANTFNLGADLGAMAKATQLIFPGANFGVLVFFFSAVSLLLQIFTTYQRYAQYLKFLALILFSYVITLFLIELDWRAVVTASLVPAVNFSRDHIVLVCAILGTTISPYLFFWQTSQEVEEGILKGRTTFKQRREALPEEIKGMKVDVWSGMFVSNLVMFCIIATCGAVLFPNGITEITTAQQAAEALRPLAGNFTYWLFAFGIIGTGLLAVPVLAGSASYALSESFGWKEGLHKKLKQAHAFYGVIVVSMALGFLFNFINIDPIRALIYSAVSNGLIAPVVLVLIVSMSSSKKIMGSWKNSRLAATVGWVITGVMVLTGLLTLATFVV
jgi:NRAMP (natural resistance-associated macrophage protein)-like metal ion transporter